MNNHTRPSDKLDVVLFALTGFGNKVLSALLDHERVNVRAVFTAKYDNPFPYYPEQHLLEFCEARNVTCYYGVKVGSDEGLQLLHKHAPHLIIVSTFKQILPNSVLSLPPLGVVNLHPSLLPRYRGPSPTNAVLLNGEKVTGISVHYITEELDAGNILFQRTIPISKTDNDGRLRHRLAILAGQIIPQVISSFEGFRKPVGTPQRYELATYAPRPNVDDGYLEQDMDIYSIARKIRALNPFPGTSILVGNERVNIYRSEIIEEKGADGLYVNLDSIDLFKNSRGIRLFTSLDD